VRRIFMPTTSNWECLQVKEEARLLVTGKIARDGPNSSLGKAFWNWLMMTKSEWEHLTVRLEAK
jgi:hypothetical protein